MIPWLDHPGLLLYRLTPWLVAPRVVVRCNAPLTVLILPLPTSSQRDRFPSLRRFCTPGALTVCLSGFLIC